jgi:membrane protein
MLRRIRLISILLRESLKEFMKNDPLRMAGATAFFTTFALPPILVIIIQSLKFIVGPDVVRSKLFFKLTETLGPEAAKQLADVLSAFRKMAANWWVTIGGFIFLLFVATTLFRVIKNSINQLWKIRQVGKASAGKTLVARFRAIVVILVAGVLFVVGLMAESAQVLIGRYLFQLSPVLSTYFNAVWATIFSLLITMSWFAIVFRYLPEGRPRWRVALIGGLLTALLFMFGKIILHWMLSYSNISNFYSTSASIVLLLLFVFYSALILYFGATFTKIWALHTGYSIEPLPGSIHYRLMEVKEDEETGIKDLKQDL